MSAGSYSISREALVIRLARAEEKIEALRVENRQLRNALSPPPPDYPAAWRLARAECFTLHALMVDNSVTRQKLLEVAPPVWKNNRDARGVSVHIFRIRAKLAPLGVEIKTLINVGYQISPAHKAVILREIEAASLPAVLTWASGNQPGASA